MKRKKGSGRELAREMYIFFSGYSESGAPSFSKFAKHKGLTLNELLSYKRHKKFKEAFDECEALRRDYLIDKALVRSFDASFVKYLLDREEENSPTELSLKLEVV